MLGSTKFQAPAFAEAASRRRAKFQINSSQKHLKFPLTPSLSPGGEGKGEGAKNIRRKFSDSTLEESNIQIQNSR
jgi:hypothetical protein